MKAAPTSSTDHGGISNGLGVRAHARKRLAYLGDLVRPAALDVVEIDPLLAERTLSVYQRAPVVLDEVVENAAVRIHHQPRFPLVAVLDVDDDAGRGFRFTFRHSYSREPKQHAGSAAAVRGWRAR